MATGAVLARILTQYSDKGSKAAVKDIARLTKKFDDFGKKARKSFAIAITATAALSIKIGKDAVDAAIEDSKSQAILAQAMMNTNGATKEAILAAEDYIKTTMFRVNVADDELRKSLATLYYATGDLTQAERLQGIALDVAASQGKDLATVTVAMTKAQQGNVGILKRLTPELSALIGKSTTAEEAFTLLGAAYGGTAEQLADLDPLTKLRLAYGETLETLGMELLPVVKEFANYVVNDVIPAIDEWVKANGTDLRDALKGALKIFVGLIDIFAKLAAFYNRFEFFIKLAAMLFFVGRAVKIFGRVFGGLTRALTGVKASVKGFADRLGKLIKGDEGIYKAAQAIGGLIEKIAKFIFGVLGFGAAFVTAKSAIKSFLGMNDKATESIAKTTKKVYGGAAAEKYKAEVTAAAAKLVADARKKAAAQEAKDAAEAAKQAKYDAAVNSRILSIRKQLNITKDSAIDKETDLINLTAAANLLAKQGVIAKEELAKLNRLKDENFLLEVRDTLAKRYADIQKVIADQKLDTKEIEELSKKWGISNESVESYIHLVQSINDGTISAEEVDKLARMWGSSNEQAKAFLETYLRIHDGILTDSEVFDLLQQGWAKTEEEVRIYADLVAIVHDGIAKDADFERLATKWEKSKEQVNAYVASMGAHFDYQGVFLDPVVQLAIKWDNATKALERYLAMLGKGFKFGDTTTVVVPPVVTTPKPGDPAVTPKAGDPNYSGDDSIARRAAASAAAAAAYAAAKSKGDMDAAATAAAGVSPSYLASQESGSIGAASIAAQLRAAETAQAIQDNITKMSRFREKEAADLAASLAASSQLDADERSKFRSMTMANASSISGDISGNAKSLNVTVNVAGTVTAENDLVQTIRTGLLTAQQNGQGLTLQAV
jgi:hypothetical protein